MQDTAPKGRSRARGALVLLGALVLGVVLLAGLAPDRTGRSDGGTDEAEEQTAGGGDGSQLANPTPPNPTPRPPVTATPRPVPTVPPAVGRGGVVAVDEPSPGVPDFDSGLNLEPAPLGTYVVAREDAGQQWIALPGNRTAPELSVYAKPFGLPRRLMDVNAVDGVEWSAPLINWQGTDGALVLRVIAGGPDDEWLMVQAPVRPNNSFVWVKRSDFDFGFTSRRIEIDLAGEGELRLIDSAEGDRVILLSGIVQGKESRPTPTHVTYLERGVLASSVSPAYGTAILSIASYSEALGTFGGGGLPSNFIHGTNQPQLMGRGVSSGEIRLPNESLEVLIAEAHPGTPVLLFDSSQQRPGRQDILQNPPVLASTQSLWWTSSPTVMSTPQDSTSGVFPHLWRRCESGETGADPASLLCRSGPAFDLDRATVFLQAKPEAGVAVEGIPNPVVPVYDAPGGEPRMLVDWNAIDGVGLRMPLQNPDRHGGPLVLWLLDVSADGEWFRVQAPVRPNRSAAWVRASDFELRTTEMRVEIDIAGEGQLTLLDGERVVVSSEIVSGKESRPTTLGVTRIDKVVPAVGLTPAYGPFVAAYPLYSEVLGTFGGGAAPNQAIHGTNQPELMGQQVSSGKIRVTNEVMAFLVNQNLLGAYVVVFDSSQGGRDAAISALERRPWTPADTTEPDNRILALAVPLI